MNAEDGGNIKEVMVVDRSKYQRNGSSVAAAFLQGRGTFDSRG